MTDSMKDQLKKLGLSERESIVMLSLIKVNSMSAAEISKISKIPRSKIYDITEKLLRKGLCKEIGEGKIKKYSAVDPKLSLPYMVSSQIDALKELHEQAKEIGEELSAEYNQINQFGYDFIHVIKNPRETLIKYQELYNNAKSSIKEFVKSPYSMDIEDMKMVKELNSNLIKKGVVIRNINEEDDLKSDLIRTATQWHIDVGAEIRLFKNLPMKLSIFDDKIAMYILNNPVTLSTELTTIIVEHTGFVNVLLCAFEDYWARAISVNKIVGE
jgi:sugar-specific transcriptional regulator TrmB